MNTESVTQPIVYDWIIELLKSKAHHGRIKVNGLYKNYPIFKTYRDGNLLRFLIYLESEIGLVEEAQLLSANDDVWAIKSYSIKKQDDGLVLAFEFDIEIVGRGVSDGV